VVEAAHVPTPATIKAATANELVLRIWVLPPMSRDMRQLN
jgi:hypothetical protein